MDHPTEHSRATGDGEPDRKEDVEREAKRDAYIAEISERLRPVCRALTDDEFGRLVADVAKTKLRFAAIDAALWPEAPGRADSNDI